MDFNRKQYQQDLYRIVADTLSDHGAECTDVACTGFNLILNALAQEGYSTDEIAEYLIFVAGKLPDYYIKEQKEIE